MLARITLAVAAMLAMHATTTLGQAPSSLWTDTFVMYNGGGTFNGQYPFLAQDPNRQHLHYALPPGFDAENPAPVLFFAHGNSGTAAGMPDKEIGGVLQQGYALVSWESVTAIRNGVEDPEGAQVDFETCVQDLDLVTEWVTTNGPALGLSASNWTISGRSRGSVISWMKAHSNLPQIQSAYFYNALPSPDITSQLSLINSASPPMYLGYGPTCPEPIIIDGPETCVSFKTDLPSACEPVPDPSNSFCVDIHNPISGIKIVTKYNELGKGDEIGFAQGWESTPGEFGIFRGFPTLLEIVANMEDSTLNSSPSLSAPLFFSLFFLAFTL